jgi:hypothetical protein
VDRYERCVCPGFVPDPDNDPRQHHRRKTDAYNARQEARAMTWAGLYVKVDTSWADTLPTCSACGRDVPWVDALIVPCSPEDGDDVTVGVVHRDGCDAYNARQGMPVA